jgi:O-antigen/teichoic acid export membrane protein
MLNTVSVSGLGLLYWFLAARVYADRDVGLNSTAISTMMFLSGLAQLNMVNALYRFVPQFGGRLPGFVTTVYRVNIGMTVAVVGGFALVSHFFLAESSFLKDSLPITIAFAVSVTLYGIFALQDGVMVGLREAIWIPLENTVFGLLKIGLLLLFAPLYPAIGIFASWAVSMLIVVVPVNLLIFRVLIPRAPVSAAAPTTPFSLWSLRRFITADYIGTLFYMCSTNLLPLIVTTLLSSKDAAYFYIAWVIGSALDVFSENMATSLTVEGAAEPAQLLAYTRKSLIHIMRLLIPVTALLLVVAPLALSVFGADYAAGATLLLRLLGIATLPRAINHLFLSVSRVRTQMRGIIIVQAATAILNLGLSFILGPRIGIAGIGIAAVLSESIVATGVIITQLLTVRTMPGNRNHAG